MLTDDHTLLQARSAMARIRTNAHVTPDDPAVIFVRDPNSPGGDETWSYARLDHEARKIAGWLQERYAPGDRVLLLYPESLQFAAAFVGCLYAGMVAVPSSLPGQYSHQRRRVDSIVENAAVAAVLTSEAVAANVLDWAGSDPGREITCAVTDGPGFTDAHAEAWQVPDVGQDTLALLQYTSGSTSDPKGVMVHHGNLLHNSAALSAAFGLDRTTRFGSWIPQYHDMGLLAILLPPLLLGGSCVLMSPTTFLKRPHWWLRMIDKYQINWSAAPNFAYELCARQITDEQLADLDLSCWRFAANGSEPVQASTLTAFAKRFAPAGFRSDTMAPCYGMAEATVFISGTGPRELAVTRVDEAALEQHEFRPVTEDRAGRDVVSCGTAEEYTVRIVDPATREALPKGRVGEIWLRGASVAQGYWGREEATRSTFGVSTLDGDTGYVRTGDLGTLHAGEIYVTGRLKEMLILRGRNIYPQDVEHALRRGHPELVGLFGAAFAVPVATADGGTEEQLVVVHEVRGSVGAGELPLLAARIRGNIARDFSVRPAAVALVRRGAVLRTTSGKIQRAAMRAQYLDGLLESRHLDGPQAA
ncbi:fatty acyl-AMP ligase [Streptomyces kunmingensis]|uniref:Fatty acyl-AMP ligase n=1 Tax=Streptomyces kunmingensis TaxID=68225 RepID=A0ABU6CG85_9ACTN|nr:fatty acyl-AMP ligase [Streptomyces kunmingensis]MEB3963718.1 fatty acyl-AMP ligase [Streptomyces kunmingensis]